MMLTKALRRMVITLTVCTLILLSSISKNAGAAETRSEAVTAESFSAAGLDNEAALTAIFLGKFLEIDFNREELVFSTLFQKYLEAYALSCSDHLPENKVEMTQKVCDLEQVTRNGFGVEIDRSCIRYVDEGTGLYAKPEMLAAKQEIDRLMKAENSRNVWRVVLISQSNPAGAISLAKLWESIISDMSSLVRKNACSGPGLTRFEENLRRFAWNEQPIRLEGDTGSAQGSKLSPVVLSRNLDYSGLIADLIADQSQSWVLNQFVNGSVREIFVSSRDAEGIPSRIGASYSFDGINGRSLGSVTVHLTEGLPSCIYFSDAPTTCRTPNRKIVAMYADKAQNAPLVSIAPPTSPVEAAAGPRAPLVSIAPPTSPVEAAVPSAPLASIAPPPPPIESVAVPPPSSDATSVGDRFPTETHHSAVEPPKRELQAVSYFQGIKDACLEVLTGGVRREPEASYCFCLSAASGTVPISEADARWFFENFSNEARKELEQRYPSLVRMFGSCHAQLKARSNPG